jgi:glycosyltransferase involved in cell wall biosynthesis
VARSLEAFTAEYRKHGHRVLVVAPKFENMPENREFEPDIVHSHHPYLIGGTALRLAIPNKLPLVFTHHTMYEQYTHYVPGDSEALKRFVIQLSTSYANPCSCVFWVPSAFSLNSFSLTT